MVIQGKSVPGPGKNKSPEQEGSRLEEKQEAYMAQVQKPWGVLGDEAAGEETLRQGRVCYFLGVDREGFTGEI